MYSRLFFSSHLRPAQLAACTPIMGIAVPTRMLPNDLSTTLFPVTVTIDGIAVTPGLEGLSNCGVGLDRITVRTPPNAHSGGDIPVFLAGRQSNTITLFLSPGFDQLPRE